jgi:uncharacterized membrane protein
MSSPASIHKHPIHPMLITLPIGLWVFALVCDVVAAAGGSSAWATVSLYSIGGGIVGALLAAVPGFIDYLSIDEPQMKRIATFHLLLNLGGLVLFGINFWVRMRLPGNSLVPLFLSLAGVVSIGIGGWLGGELVYVKGMAVEPVEKSTQVTPDRSSKGGPLRRAS